MQTFSHSPSLGTVNKSVLDATGQAYAVAVKLAHRGFVVKGIMAGKDDPVVWLVNTGRCQSLDSCRQKIIRSDKGRVSTKVALVDGCEIRWEEKESI